MSDSFDSGSIGIEKISGTDPAIDYAKTDLGGSFL